MHYIASVAVAVTISPLLLKFHSRHQWAAYRKCAEIHRVHFIDYNKLWCLISFPLWVGFSSLFPQSYFVICLLCFLSEFCFGANGFCSCWNAINYRHSIERVRSHFSQLTKLSLFKAPAFGPQIFGTWSYERGYFSMFVQINKTMYVTLKQYYFQLPNLFWQFFFYENYCSVVFVCFTISTKRPTEKHVNYTKNAMKLSVFFWDTFIMAFYYQ